MADPDVIEVAGHTVRLRRNGRAKRLTLRIGAQGPTLTIPKRCNLREARGFLERHQDWLHEKISVAPARVRVTYGTDIPFAGQKLTIAKKPSGKPQIVNDRICASAAPDKIASAIKAFLISEARADLIAATRDYTRKIGRDYGKITLRDTRSRWGSCSSTGNLNYSWRLIMAPAEVLDYVAAHEVAHLVEMNHGPQFWSLVAKICPDYAVYRDWLRQNGPELHRYDFDT